MKQHSAVQGDQRTEPHQRVEDQLVLSGHGQLNHEQQEQKAAAGADDRSQQPVHSILSRIVQIRLHADDRSNSGFSRNSLSPAAP